MKCCSLLRKKAYGNCKESTKEGKDDVRNSETRTIEKITILSKSMVLTKVQLKGTTKSKKKPITTTNPLFQLLFVGMTFQAWKNYSDKVIDQIEKGHDPITSESSEDEYDSEDDYDEDADLYNEENEDEFENDVDQENDEYNGKDKNALDELNDGENNEEDEKNDNEELNVAPEGKARSVNQVRSGEIRNEDEEDLLGVEMTTPRTRIQASKSKEDIVVDEDVYNKLNESNLSKGGKKTNRD